MVGPFIFFDHFGPAEFRAGAGLDVRPHPHIGLATVTYLFDGEIMHRDSLGTALRDPAGRGQLDDRRPRHRAFRAHRRRSGARTASPMHGLQMWVALPAAHEEMAPAFAHHDADGISGRCARTARTCASWSARPIGARSPVPALHRNVVRRRAR